MSLILKCWAVRLGLAGTAIWGIIAFSSTALAQVVPDNTVGSAVSGISGGEQTITGGTRQGGNLFHSFDRFSVPTNGAAIFRNDLDIQNILSRVTGGSISNIDGLIGANGAANLFLLNPNGIVFGQNARLNIGGSFIATTASSINFADGTQFSATPGTGAPLLTVSVPLGLQFGTSPGNIINRANGVGLQVGAGKALGLVGGNVNLEGGRLTAAGGRIELGAVTAPGVVGISPDNSGFRFSFPTDLTLGDISLTADASASPPRPALVDVRAGGGGSIAVNARNLNIFSGSELLAGILQNRGSVDAVAGDIDINVKDAIAIDSLGINDFRSGIFNNVETGSTGKGGNINVKTGSLRLSNGAVLVANTQGQGDAGSLQITATNPNDSVVFESGSFIQTDSFSQSNAGNVTITADGRVSFVNGGTYSRAVTSEGLGKGGSITIQARSLSLDRGAQINTSASGQGDAGNLTITANEGVFLDNSSSIRSAVESTGVGKGGDINVKARSFSLSNKAFLATSTSGQGNAGNIQVNVIDSLSASGSSILEADSSGIGNGGNVTITAGGSVTFDGIEDEGVSSGVASRLFSIPELQQDNSTEQILQVAKDRRGGDITIKARSLSLLNGAQVGASTFSQGDAGNVNIDVSETTLISGFAQGLNSGLFSNIQQGGDGKGGFINVKTGSLSLSNSGSIAADTSGIGDAGNISIIADGGRIAIIDGGRIVSRVLQTGTGRGGDITIKARSLDLTNGSFLSTSTLGQGNAGNVFVQVDELIDLANSSYIFSNVESGAVGNGGTVEVKANSLSLTDGAQIQALVRGTADPLPGGRGNAGKINIEIDDTFTATGASQDGLFPSGVFNYLDSGAVGKGGDINIKVGTLSLEDRAQVNANTFGNGDAGNINITADDRISLDNSLIFSDVGQGGKGKGGNLTINAGSLSLNNGAALTTSTFGQGDAGNLHVDVTDSISVRDGSALAVDSYSTSNAGSIIITAGGDVSFDKAGNEGFVTGVFGRLFQIQELQEDNPNRQIPQIPSDRRGGDITIKARSLSIANGAQVGATTFSQGNAGNVSIEVSDTVFIDGVGRFDNGVDRGIFRSGVFNNVQQGGKGKGGNINVKAGTLSLTNSGTISASNTLQGEGDAGNITIDVHTLNFNGGVVFAISESGNGGNIELNASKSLRLRNGSQISTSAGGTEQGGNGGNITINSPLVIANANGNNDITANAFRGSGGRIEINAQSIIGLIQRSRPDLLSLIGTDTPTEPNFLTGSVTNDVAAISLSDPSFSGTISFNTADIDPSRDIVELPTGLVDASALVASGCPSGAENRFVVAGRGGLPPAPGDKLSTDALLTDWATLETPETENRAAVEPATRETVNTTTTPLVEATTWQFGSKGEIILTNANPTTPNQFEATPSNCPSS
ncbi:MAG: hypothetical protein N4J56_004637 [Chroococcidiopsis sp. SAG 2025]|uniref:two-partner secretion domain-containing protein n=1 Tax=Chroococcidiopsis sp. SAG 2025 TaxID=171389 RepID=UPI002936FAFB|nr:filamentous hemagglutinin N-terminal domain-containing protein [Chroococcidiopsis sp. SAG 2025]MDV2994983.1 hypothetical protein [Chroococcidiopsis sp. SAG 2025]